MDKKKKKIVTGFVVFLGLMWLCTLISRSVYAAGLPMASAVLSEKKYVEHIVEAEGIVEEGGQQAVVSLDGLRVEVLMVHVGDEVAKGDVLFQVDLEDLQEMIGEKQTEITKLQYQISAIQENQKLAQQRKALEEERARQDYDDTARQKDTDVGRAKESYVQAENDLDEHNNDPVYITSDEDRQKAWDDYYSWTERKEELTDRIAEQEKAVTNMESPSDDGSGSGSKTDEEKKALEDAKAELERWKDALAEHEKNQVSEPDFSQEDSAFEAWLQERELLQDSLQSAAYGEADAERERYNSMKGADRNVEDALWPDNLDATLSIYQLELSNLQEKLSRYQQILENQGNVAAQADGVITDIFISVGARVPDTAALLMSDNSVPLRFKAVLDKEQKKYIGLGDQVSVKLDGGNGTIEADIEYLLESETVPGSYESLITLPEAVGTPGLSGVLTHSEAGEKYACCLPTHVIHKTDTRTFVYVVREREGILGMEYYVDEINVKVLDQNDEWIAIGPESIGEETKVIASTTKEISKGDVIRLQE